ncbi:vWA domain-containing protein, partial [Streptococcus phocae subsp. phocae]
MKKVDYKLISLVATAGLIFSQLALPVAQVASTTGHAETHQSPSGERASPASNNSVSKETEKTQSEPTAVSTTQTGDITVTLDTEKSAEGFEKATASLASLETSDATKRNDQDLDKLSQELKKQSLKITDAQIIDLTNLPISENLGVALTFKEGLALAGLTEKDKNLKIGILTSESDEVSVVDAEKVTLTDKEEGQAQKVEKLSYKGKATQPSTRIIIARTKGLSDRTKLDLKNYGKLVLDGTTEQEKTDQLSPYRKPVTIKVLQPKKDTIESTFESADFEEVKTFEHLFVWQKDLSIIDYLSDDYQVVKTEYQKANAKTFETKEMLYGDYEAVNHARDDNISENVVKVYLRSSKPLELAPMLPAKGTTLAPRSFRSALSGREEGKKTKRSRFKRSLLPTPKPRSARNKRSVQLRSVEPKVDKSNIEHHKRIDYLGDGDNNPDTTIDDTVKDKEELEDLYRLYLDMTGTKEALDVLVVVDKSGSMQEGIESVEKYRYQKIEWNKYYRNWYYTGYELFDNNQGQSFYRDKYTLYRFEKKVVVSSGAKRDSVVKQNLLGEMGLLQKMLNINPENNIAVIGFQGSVEYKEGNWQLNNSKKGGIFQPKIEDSIDAEVLQKWGHAVNITSDQLTALNNNGTNYHAALLKASELLQEVAKNGRRKVMIFISDGVPTFYFGNDGYRKGSGSSNQEDNILQSQKGTKIAINEFKDRNPGVTTYSLGVSKDINSNTASSSPVVLQYLSGEEHYRAITKADELKNTLGKIIEASQISDLEISDTLSNYVDFYKKKSEIKVVRKSKLENRVDVLYEKGQLTSEGTGIIKAVKFEEQ